MYFNILLFLPCFCHGHKDIDGWEYLNIHCRDNSNAPVDWWYIYKPPVIYEDHFKAGRNFTYITPSTAGHWQSSDTHITDTSMLQYTLSPMYRPTYVDHLSYIVYETHSSNPKSKGYGILMADELSGLWITHTVPGLPDLNKDRASFPETEVPNGHLLTCLSLDSMMLNELAVTLKLIEPRVFYLQVPPSLRSTLHDWVYFDKTFILSEIESSLSLDFLSKFNTLRAHILVRRPGDTQCLYRTFAKSRKIILDVYEPDYKRQVQTFCRNGYGIRVIGALCIKIEESVTYVQERLLEKARFAVSTAAHWQQRGSGPIQHWTCTSHFGLQDRSKDSGIILCIDNYDIWFTFTNLKIKEPQCEN